MLLEIHFKDLWPKGFSEFHEIRDINTSQRWCMDNLNIGEKPHKFSRRADPTQFNCKVFTERGDFEFAVQSSESIDDGLMRFRSKWLSIRNNNVTNQ